MDRARRLPLLEPTPSPAVGADVAGPARPRRQASRETAPSRCGPWQAELRACATSVAHLERALELTPAEREGALLAERQGLPLRVTPYYLGLADRHDPRCPVRLQCVPRAEEGITVAGDLADPLGEEAHEVAPHLVQRYPDRALLLATDRCAVYCRFCTRSRMVGDGGGSVSLARLAEAFAYLERTPTVRDVIVSGGDPLAQATPRIVGLIERLRQIPHLDTIRLATRVPVTLPSRVTVELVRALRPFHPLWVMTHFNHPKELTADSVRACERLADHGFPVMNQTVLLRGINDDARTLEALFRGLIRARVRPYYLLQMDPVRGTSHLRTPLSRGVELMEALQGKLTGIALPRLIVDTPGGMGKVPVGPDYVVARREGAATLRTHRGVTVDYIDPP
jgi:lysine 2,3-aminomutase